MRAERRCITVRIATDHVDDTRAANRGRLKPKFELKVDLDERAFLFPAGKSISQILFQSDARRIYVEAVYPFNQSRTPLRLPSLELEMPESLDIASSKPFTMPVPNWWQQAGSGSPSMLLPMGITCKSGT